MKLDYIGSILFEPTGPLMFRGPMEFTPTVRGPQAFARTLPIPLPSTVAGCLAALMLEHGNVELPEEDKDWERSLMKILGIDKQACLRGPYLLVENEVYVPLGEGVIKLKDLLETFNNIEAKKILSISKPLERFFSGSIIRLKKMEYIGKGLRRSTKTVERGLLYSAEFVDYISTFHGRKVYISVDVHGQTPLSKLFDSKSYTIRLGGEGKIVRVKFKKEEYCLWKSVRGALKKAEGGENVFVYMVNPSFIETPIKFPNEDNEQNENRKYNAFLTTTSKGKGFEFRIGSVHVRLINGRISVLGAGFDIRRKVRKPMYAAVTHGSLLLVEKGNTRVDELYYRGLSDVGGKLGYGTFIPLPIIA